MMLNVVLQDAWAALRKEPLRLWSLRLLCSLLEVLAILGFLAVPAVSAAVVLALEAALSVQLLRGCRGEETQTMGLLAGLSKENARRVIGGMGWRALKLGLWGLIPAAGPVLMAIHGYRWRLTPYLLMERPDCSARQALCDSEEQTAGYRRWMFLGDLLLWGPGVVMALVLLLLGQIRFVGTVFYWLLGLLVLTYLLAAPLLAGLIHASFYEQICRCNADPAYKARLLAPRRMEPGEAPLQGPVHFCPNCGTPATSSAHYCANCGTPLDPQRDRRTLLGMHAPRQRDETPQEGGSVGA